MATTLHYLFEIETEREGLDSVRDLTRRLESAARQAGGSVHSALVTTDLDHVFAVVEVTDGKALSEAVLRLSLPGVIWFSGPDPVRVLPAGGSNGATGGQVVAEHAFGSDGGVESGLSALRAAAAEQGAEVLTAWWTADPAASAASAAQPTALVVYGSAVTEEVRAAADAAGVPAERLLAVREVTDRPAVA